MKIAAIDLNKNEAELNRSRQHSICFLSTISAQKNFRI